MATVTALRKQPPPLSPSRQNLADRIAESEALNAEHAALTDAVAWGGRARASVAAAERALEAAKSDLEAAKIGATVSLTAEALGHPPVAAMSVKDARAAVVSAEDDLDIAKASLEAVQRKLADVESRRDALRTYGTVKNAALAVLQDEGPHMVSEMLDRLHRAQREVIGIGLALAWLDGQGMFERRAVPDFGSVYLDPRISSALGRFQISPASWTEPDVQTHLTMIEAMQLLMQDATASLPEIL